MRVNLNTHGFKIKTGEQCEFPVLNKQSLINAGANLVVTKVPHLCASDLVISTGEVEKNN